MILADSNKKKRFGLSIKMPKRFWSINYSLPAVPP